MLCKCIFPSQFPGQWTLENKSSSFSPWPPPLPLSVLASQLSSHRACSPRAPLLLGEFRKQGRGVKPVLNMHFCFFLKYVQSLLKWDPPPPFPMWQCFLQIVDIPSKTFVEKKKTCNRCVYYTKEPVVLLTMSPSCEEEFCDAAGDRELTERFLSRWRMLRRNPSLSSHWAFEVSF